MEYNVFIPTAGIGSRLGTLTKYLNKSLISISAKPAISHIIEKYPSNIVFIIALGYKGHLVKEFIELAYPERKFIFVEINPYQGDGSGLGHTLISCKKHLDKPFIFHSCDTLVAEDIPPPLENWLGIGACDKIESFRTIKINKNKVTKFFEKNSKVDSLNKPYIGLCGVNNINLFWDKMDDCSKDGISIGEVYGLENLIPNIKAINFTWYDTGQLENLKKTRLKIKEANSPNILEKPNEEIWFVAENVIKFSSDKSFIKNRVKRSKILYPYVPSIKEHKKYMYKYKFVRGEIISECINIPLFNDLLNHSKIFWNMEQYETYPDIDLNRLCEKFYKEKTYKRIKAFHKKNEIEDSSHIINNIEVSKIETLLERINWEKICCGKKSRFHGDFHFENILFDKDRKIFTFIDWRQDFSEEINYGDIYYDLSKLLHGLIINHSIINEKLFSINIEKNKKIVDYDFNRKQVLVDCELFYYKWLKSEGFDVLKVKIITSLIFLNIASLHHYPYSHLLYFLGKKMLSEQV